MNAFEHLAMGFSFLLPDNKALRLDNYRDKDGGVHPSISDNPFIVLSADNSNQIRTLRNMLIENNIPFNDFTDTIIDGTFTEQKQRTSQTPESELEYYGICRFAPDTKAKELTKKFSLWK